MDAIKYFKGEYEKMVLKGIKIPFSDLADRVLVMFRIMAMINARATSNAMRLQEEADATFIDNFEAGIKMSFDKEKNNVSLMIRTKNILMTLFNYLSVNLEKLEKLMPANTNGVDISIIKYYQGNIAVMKKSNEYYNKIAQEIQNSLNVCFSDDVQKVQELEAQLKSLQLKTEEDIRNYNNKSAELLDLGELKW
ncbi:MAG: hypothetical protein QW045_02685 [Candidatus Micrarchaeaceae archaeon]